MYQFKPMSNSNKYVVTIGGSNVDIISRSKKKILIGESNISEIDLTAGGVIRNIAENLCHLKHSCYLITVFGDDEFGNYLKNNCKNSGININHSLNTKLGNTATYLSVNDHTGEMLVAANDTKILENLTPEFLSSKKSLINDAEAIVIDSNLSKNTIKYILNNFKNKFIFADPVSKTKSSKLKKYLSFINVIKPNLEEAKFLFDLKSIGTGDLKALSLSLSKKNVEKIIISLGSKGIISFNNGEIKKILTKKQRVQNVNGAGDALMAGLIHGHLKNWEWDYNVKFAISMANISLQSKSTVNSDLSEKKVFKFLNENIL